MFKRENNLILLREFLLNIIHTVNFNSCQKGNRSTCEHLCTRQAEFAAESFKHSGRNDAFKVVA